MICLQPTSNRQFDIRTHFKIGLGGYFAHYLLYSLLEIAGLSIYSCCGNCVQLLCGFCDAKNVRSYQTLICAFH